MTIDDLRELSADARAAWLVLFAAAMADGANSALRMDRAWEIAMVHGIPDWSVEKVAVTATEFLKDPDKALLFMEVTA